MKTKIALFLLALTTVAAGFIVIRFYSYVFARIVTGEVIAIERVIQPSTVINTSPAAGNNQIPASQLFSFAVAIRDKTGEIHTASTEDRQWAVVNKGQCVQAKFLRYPFWEFDKAGTFFGARLERMFDCPAK